MIHNRKRKRELRRNEKGRIGLDPWVDHDKLLVEKTPGEILLDDTVPVTQDNPKLIVKLKVPQEKEHKSSPTTERKKQTKEQKEAKKLRKAKLVVKDHHKDAATKQWARG